MNTVKSLALVTLTLGFLIACVSLPRVATGQVIGVPAGAVLDVVLKGWDDREKKLRAG